MSTLRGAGLNRAWTRFFPCGMIAIQTSRLTFFVSLTNILAGAKKEHAIPMAHFRTVLT